VHKFSTALRALEFTLLVFGKRKDEFERLLAIFAIKFIVKAWHSSQSANYIVLSQHLAFQ